MSDPVSLPRGASTMVSMLTLRGGAEDVYLFRPDGHVRGSERHPLRAARLHIGMALEPGPVTVFARGSFVGEGRSTACTLGETALVPLRARLRGQGRSESEDASLPLRLLSIPQRRGGGGRRVDPDDPLRRHPGAQPPAPDLPSPPATVATP